MIFQNLQLSNKQLYQDSLIINNLNRQIGSLNFRQSIDIETKRQIYEDTEGCYWDVTFNRRKRIIMGYIEISHITHFKAVKNDTLEINLLVYYTIGQFTYETITATIPLENYKNRKLLK